MSDLIRQFGCLAILVAMASCRSPVQSVAALGEVRHRLDFFELVPYIRLKTVRGDPLRLVLDTGAHGLVLTSDALRLVPGAKRIGTSRIAFERRVVECPTYQLGPLNWDAECFDSIVAHVVDRETHWLFADGGLDGLLGIEAFRDRIVTFDYLRREVIFHNSGKMLPRESEPIPMRMDEHYVLVEAEVGKSKGTFLVDTGTTYTVLSPEFHRKTGLPDPVTKTDSLGNSELQSLLPCLQAGPFRSGPLVARIKNIRHGFDGKIGSHLILRTGILILDYRHKKAIFPFRNRSEMLQECKKRASEGTGWALYRLFIESQDQESGVPSSETVSWLEKGARAGFPDALFDLGQGHYHGWWSLQKDMKAALHWFERAASAGHVGAKSYLGAMYRDGIGTAPDVAQGLRYMREAAAAGEVQAQSDLGHAYIFGSEGFKGDAEEGAEWLLRAAQRGDAAAQTNLGVCHKKGLGVPKSIEDALKWYLRAAAQGNAQAMFNLGWHYEKDEKDADNAREWYMKAAGLAHPEAADALKRLELNRE